MCWVLVWENHHPLETFQRHYYYTYCFYLSSLIFEVTWSMYTMHSLNYHTYRERVCVRKVMENMMHILRFSDGIDTRYTH